MAMKALDIYKHLPGRTAKCGYPTCLAFAMKLAVGRRISGLPDIDPQQGASWGDQTAGEGGHDRCGDDRSQSAEFVMFRHETSTTRPGSWWRSPTPGRMMRCDPWWRR